VKKLVLAAGAAAALAVPVTAIGADGDKATGGGQILFTTSDAKRSTITFNAQQTGDAVKGQINIIDRSGSTTGKGAHIRGTVTCITVMGTVAMIGGTLDNEQETPFFLRVQDNGEGAAAGADLVEYDNVGEDADCEQDGSSG
jgi:hypothetical protein